jgi:hypothetical protein
MIAIGFLWLLLAASLLIYREMTPPRVEITWETATEQGTAGFNLYRSSTRDGEYELINEGDFIESKGSPVSGAEYNYVDEDVAVENVYFYVLEEIETDGTQLRYDDDIFEYVVPGSPAWLLILIGICSLLGAVILFIGFKETKSV